MSFESGGVSLRMFYLMKPLPDRAEEAFARHAAPPLKTLGVEEINGWVGSRHLLDVPIAEDNAFVGGHLRLHLLRAERRIPASLFRATCLMEEFARMRADRRPFLDRATRSAIRKEVEERLLPDMPPQLRAVAVAADAPAGIVYASSVSEKQCDALRIHWLKTVGSELIAVDAATAAAKRRKADVRDWPACAFSPEVENGAAAATPGEDFLTWLWFMSEARGGVLKDKELGEFAFMLEGPLLFTTEEGNGALEAVVRKGAPLASAEAKACLLAGKKLRRARLTLARADEGWACSFDASSFVVRGLRLPDPKEALDPVSRFQDRMVRLGQFRDLLLSLYDRFVDERNSPAAWRATLEEIRRWVSGRKTRR